MSRQPMRSSFSNSTPSGPLFARFVQHAEEQFLRHTFLQSQARASSHCACRVPCGTLRRRYSSSLLYNARNVSTFSIALLILAQFLSASPPSERPKIPLL